MINTCIKCFNKYELEEYFNNFLCGECYQSEMLKECKDNFFI